MNARPGVGPFELESLIGTGGMGEVWLARHVHQGVEVAVKIITRSRAQKANFQQLFRHEVRAIAALHHRGVLHVVDFGQVDAKEAARSGGRLHAGSPYLVTELADTALNHWAERPLDWAAARDILLQLLAALAHAHARGIIHRDIKPSNVLVYTGGGHNAATAVPTVKLGDFGLAAPAGGAEAVASADRDGKLTGTPKYMAPEQILGEWRDQGPWTDLYSLGCVGFWLLTGRSPFERSSVTETLRAHLSDPVPTVEDGVPRGLDAWLRGMLAKHPVERFQCAADAARALEALGEPRARSATSTSGADGAPADPTLVFEADTTAVSGGADTTVVSDPPSPDTIIDVAGRDLAQACLPRSAVARPRAGRPAVPSSWAGRAAPARPMRLIGAGLGLFGIREVPMVDRQAERDRLWEALTDVQRLNAASAVTIGGMAGCGKSRLAEWLTRRAAELGLATILRASHGPIAGPTDGVAGMLSALARCRGLGPQETLERIKRLLSYDGLGRDVNVLDAHALADLVQPMQTGRPGKRAWLEHASRHERHGPVLRLIERLCQDRAVLLWLDDVQWGPEALSLAQFLLERGRDLPVLIVLTVRDDVLPERAVESELFEALASHERFERLQLASLSPADHRELVDRLLPLEPDLSERVARRTEGNPLFAAQLVGDWVERGLLAVGDDGFTLADAGRKAGLPDSIHRLWLDRLERITGRADDPDQAMRALEVAAALGLTIDDEEWRLACAEAGCQADPRLADALAARGMARRTEGGWAFGHGLLRESLERNATAAGRHGAHHTACARVLRALYGEDRLEPTRRIAAHLLAAGDYEAAVGPLQRAAEFHNRQGDYERALALDDQRTAALDAAGAPACDPRRIEGWLHRSRILTLQNEVDAAAALADRAADALADRAADAPNPRLEAELNWARSFIARRREDAQTGLRLLEQAVEIYAELGDAVGVGRCQRRLGELLRRTGQIAASATAYREAMRIFEAHDMRFELAWVHMGLGTTLRELDQPEEGRRHVECARAYFEETGSQVGLVNTYNELGEFDRAEGRHASAEANYRQGMELCARLDYPEFDIFTVNIGLTLLPRGEFDQAHTLFGEVLERGLAQDLRGIQLYAHIGLLACDAHRGNCDGLERHLGDAERLLEQIDLVDRDIAFWLDYAGRTVSEQAPDQARRALMLAADQWTRLGETEQAEAARRLADAVEAG